MNRAPSLATLALVLSLTANVPAVEPPITALAFAPDGKSLVGVSQSGVHIYSWPNLKRQRTLPTSAANLHCLAFSPDAEHLAVGGGNPAEVGIVEVFAWPTGKSMAVLKEHTDSVRAVRWHGENGLISAGLDRRIKRWQLDKAKSLATLEGHSRGVSSLTLLRDGKTLVSAADDQSVRVWNMDSGKNLRSSSQHTGAVHALALRPGAEGLPMVASAAEDRTIRLWQPSIGRMVRYIRLRSGPLDIEWSPDGSRLFASCIDGHLRVIDPTEVKVLEDITVLEGWGYAVAVHPNDGSLAVAGPDGLVRRVVPKPAKP